MENSSGESHQIDQSSVAKKSTSTLGGQLLHVLEEFRAMVHHMTLSEAVRILHKKGIESGMLRLKQVGEGDPVAKWIWKKTSVKIWKEQVLDSEILQAVEDANGILCRSLILPEGWAGLGLWAQTTEHTILFVAGKETFLQRGE